MKKIRYALAFAVLLAASVIVPLTLQSEDRADLSADVLIATSGEAVEESSIAGCLDATDENDGTEQGEADAKADATPAPAPAACGNAASSDTSASISPLSGWGDGDAVYQTRIRLTARDRQDNPVVGVVYGLYDADGQMVRTLTTGVDGVAESGDISADTDYYLNELSVPDRWQPVGTRKEIRLTDVCAPSRIEITVQYDPIQGTIQVVKTDESGNALAGVVFQVLDSSGSTMGTLRTDAAGKADIVVPYGKYTLNEVVTPTGYVGGGAYSVDITHSGQTNVPIQNRWVRGKASVQKTGNDGRNIANAVFALYTSADTWLEDIVTNRNGYAVSSPLPYGDYYLIEKSVPAPYVADTQKHPFPIRDEGQVCDFHLVNVVGGKPGALTVIKTDDSANPLPGVVFGVYRAWDDVKLCELTTGEDGRAVTPNALIPGDYYLQELAGLNGYEMNDERLAFTVDGSGEDVHLTVQNPKIRIYGKVRVKKTDDTGAPLDGVKFGVYCDAGVLIEELTTVRGTAVSGILSMGNYTLKELSGVPGYQVADMAYPFTIESNATVSVDVVNPRIMGAVKIVKTSEDGSALSGVVFGVYKADTGMEVCKLITDANGSVTSGALPYGEYELRELAAADGYEPPLTPFPFRIGSQDEMVEIAIANHRIIGGLKVVKTDAENGRPLPGAVFGLYDTDGQKLAELTTDGNGEATRHGLVKGAYVLKELSAPEGYVAEDSDYPFSVSVQGEMVQINSPNRLARGTLRVLKIGDSAELLPGVIFAVYQNAEQVAEIATDENGVAEVILPLGSYELIETHAAEGYLPSHSVCPRTAKTWN